MREEETFLRKGYPLLALYPFQTSLRDIFALGKPSAKMWFFYQISGANAISATSMSICGTKNFGKRKAREGNNLCKGFSLSQYDLPPTKNPAARMGGGVWL